MTYRLRIGTTKHQFASLDDIDAQAEFKNTLLNNHQIYCLCTVPNPILTLTKLNGKFRPASVVGHSLIQHSDECLYAPHGSNSKPVQSKNNGELKIEDLWVAAQLNIWTPKMTAKRSEETIKKTVTKAAKHMGIKLSPLSECTEGSRTSNEVNYYFGLVDITENGMFTGRKQITMPVAAKEEVKKIKTIIKGRRNLKTLALLKRGPNHLKEIQLLITEKNYLPLNKQSVQVSLGNVIAAVRQKKRFYISNTNQEVIEF